MRVWFSGPRILGGLVRPGVSFGPSDFGTSKRSTASARNMTGSFMYVIERADGRCTIGASRDPIQKMSKLQAASPTKLRFAYIGATPGTGEYIDSAARNLLDAYDNSKGWFVVPKQDAVNAIVKAASNVGEKIVNVDPQLVPQIIKLASQPEPPREFPVFWTMAIGVALLTWLILYTDFFGLMPPLPPIH